MKRQALYACITCTEEGKLSGAICLPCMYQCHENHDLVELWTKRQVKLYLFLFLCVQFTVTQIECYNSLLLFMYILMYNKIHY